MREDLRGTGVGVSCIMPGFIRDAGMFADSGVTLPRGVGTNSPEDVAAAVVRAVERNKGEIDIAPLVIRAGGLIAGFAPALAATGARIFGSTTISQKMTAGQAEKR
jgi:short-subunit dehydrogenase